MTQLTQTASGLVTDDIPVPRRKAAARTGVFSQRSITQVISVIGGLALWELLARYAVHNTAFLAPPSLVAVRFYQMLRDGSLLYNGWVSFQELIGGFVLGVAAGIIIGAAMVQWKRVDDALEVWIAALYAAPIVALAPILIIWFGFGPWSEGRGRVHHGRLPDGHLHAGRSRIGRPSPVARGAIVLRLALEDVPHRGAAVGRTIHRVGHAAVGRAADSSAS